MTGHETDPYVEPELDLRLRHTLRTVAATVTEDPPAVRTPAPRRVFAVAAAVLVLMLLGTWAVVTQWPAPAPERIALGDETLPDRVRDGGNLCLAEARDNAGLLGEFKRPRLVNFAEHPWLTLLVYRNDAMLFLCTVDPSKGAFTSSLGLTPITPAIDGPITFDHLGTQALEGEYFAAAGRVSARVGRVVFDGGPGQVRDAKIAGGVFVTVGGYTTREGVVIITYDHAGKEIDRRRPWREHCPEVVPGMVCAPAEPWDPARSGTG